MVDETTIIKKMKQREFTESVRGMNRDIIATITFIIENANKPWYFAQSL